MATPPRILTLPLEKLRIHVSIYECDRRINNEEIRIDVLYQTKNKLSATRREAIEKKILDLLQKEIDKESARDKYIKITPDRAKKIIYEYNHSKKTLDQLARENKVSREVIRKIMVGERVIDQNV